MIFYGHGSVWDKRRGGILCRFSDGKFETVDPSEIGYLVKAGYKNDGNHPVVNIAEKEYTQDEIKPVRKPRKKAVENE